MRRLFAIWCMSSVHLFSEEAVFTGKLIRKYYQHLIPQAVELDAFGWFLELDSSSKVCLEKKIAAMNEEDRQCCERLGFDLSIVQLFLPGVKDRQLCRHFEGERVEVLGQWPLSPHVFRPIPPYQLHLTEIKQIPDDLVSVSGVLQFKVFPGPPNYHSVEDGDYPEGCWVLKLDDRSKSALAVPFGDEIAIEMDKGALEQYANAQVTCLGIVQHAESAHHHTPLLLRSCRINKGLAAD